MPRVDRIRAAGPDSAASSTPRVTVGLPVYNGMPHLPDAVQSILGQTLREFRLLIVNDGSTDGSADYLASIRDPRVTVVHQPNRGLGATLNRTLDLCETDYYARMDADDLAAPRRLERQLAYLETHPEVGLLGTQVSFLAGDREWGGPRKPLDHRGIGEALFRGVNALCHASLMMRTSVARAAGYRIDGAGEDFDFFLRMHESTIVENLPMRLYTIRIHDGSLNYSTQRGIGVGRAYALACARRRRAGEPEPSLTMFRRDWDRRSRWLRLHDLIDCWSAVQYRRSLVDMAHSRCCVGACRLLVAACCRPKAVLRRIRLPGASGQQAPR